MFVLCPSEMHRIRSGWILTCDSVHSLWLLSVIWCPYWESTPLAPWTNISLLYFRDTEQTSLCLILVMSSSRLGSNKYKLVIGLTCPGLSVKVSIIWSILHSRCICSLRYFLFQWVVYNWSIKGCGMCCPVHRKVYIKDPSLLIRKSSTCGNSGFPLKEICHDDHIFDVQ